MSPPRDRPHPRSHSSYQDLAGDANQLQSSGCPLPLTNRRRLPPAQPCCLCGRQCTARARRMGCPNPRGAFALATTLLLRVNQGWDWSMQHDADEYPLATPNGFFVSNFALLSYAAAALLVVPNLCALLLPRPPIPCVLGFHS